MHPWPTSDSQPHNGKRKCCRSLLAGLQYPISPPPSAEETPGACRAPRCICTGSQAQSLCLQIQAVLAGLQAPGTCAEHVQRNSPKLESQRWQKKQPQAVLPLWRMAEKTISLSKPDATAHFSTRSSLLPRGILQCLKSGLSISQNWNLSLEGFALKKGK